MNCPQCGGASGVTESGPPTNYRWRRRRCKVCGYTFHTIEATISKAPEGVRWSKPKPKRKDTT